MNIAAILGSTVQRHPHAEALVFEGRRWSYQQWNERINRVANAFAAMGVRPFDRVALYLFTGEACATAYFACQKIGAVAVPMNFRLAAGELAHILRDSGARLLVYSHSLRDQVAQARELGARPSGCIAVGGDGGAAEALPPGHLRYDDLAESGGDSSDPGYSARADDLSSLMYTSGTTGRAKGVMHTHANDAAIAMNCVMEYSLTPADRALHVAPLYHVGGLQAYFLPHVMVGGANVIEARYTAPGALNSIRDERITTLFAVPAQIQEMLFHPDFARGDVATLRMVTTGGAAMSSTTMRHVLDEFCPVLFNGYGMTEASLTLLLRPSDALARLGACGKPTLLSQARIVVNDAGRDVHPDETVPEDGVGQLIVKGPQMTRGYWNNAAESARKLRHGWLYTGDLFSRDAEGYFTFRGRADDMIVSGGENIYPREVEDVLYRCPGVREAAVVGLPDEKWGMAVAAFIVRGDPALAAAAVDAFCRDSNLIAAFKRPRRIVFVDELPRNPSGKVLKRELVHRYRQHNSAPKSFSR
jgi:fatty-acyl-CoA synthase